MWLEYVKGKASSITMELFLKIEGHDYFTRDSLFKQLWPAYQIPTDAGGFLPGLLLLGSNSRGSVSVSDMMLPGGTCTHSAHFSTTHD